MGFIAVHGRLGRAALLLIIEGRTREFGCSVMSHSLALRGALIAAPMGPRGGLNGADRLG